MKSGQETEQVYSFNAEPTRRPGAVMLILVLVCPVLVNVTARVQ